MVKNCHLSGSIQNEIIIFLFTGNYIQKNVNFQNTPDFSFLDGFVPTFSSKGCYFYPSLLHPNAVTTTSSALMVKEKSRSSPILLSSILESAPHPKLLKEASQIVASKISQINQILTSSKIHKDDISTQSISIYPQYEYPDWKMQLVGQQAQQTLSVTVRGIDENGGNLGSIIDQLVKVDGIEFNGLTFDKKDKSAVRKEARKLAFDDAKNKAQDFAQLARQKFGKSPDHC